MFLLLGSGAWAWGTTTIRWYSDVQDHRNGSVRREPPAPGEERARKKLKNGNTVENAKAEHSKMRKKYKINEINIKKR